jgi:hypothetical protein
MELQAFVRHQFKFKIICLAAEQKKRVVGFQAFVVIHLFSFYWIQNYLSRLQSRKREW